MAYKTIGVKVTGQAEVLAMSKLVNGLQREVANVLKDIQRLGRQNTVVPFNVKLKIDTNDAVTQFIKLKKQLEKHTIDLKIKGVSGSNSSNTVVKGVGELSKQAEVSVSSLKELNKEVDKLAEPVKIGFFEKLTKSKQEIQQVNSLLQRTSEKMLQVLKNTKDATSFDAITAINAYATMYARGKTRNQLPSKMPNIQAFLPKTDTGYISFEKHARKVLLNQLKAYDGVDEEYVDIVRQLMRLGDEFENATTKTDNFRDAVKDLQETLKRVTDSYTKLVKLAGEWAMMKPASAMLKSFVVLNREIIKMNTSLGVGIGNALTSSARGALSQVKMFVSQTLGTLKTETAELGDAMEVYRLSMKSLGFSDKDTNLSMKRLGDYGKDSVYDAKDLLGLASNLYAYDRTDAEDIVKAIAGLTAQTKNPQHNFNRVQTQLVQMMGAGVLNQQDWRYMRDAMNALGQSEVIDALTALAKAKGYKTLAEASRKKGITSEEVLDILKSVGNSDKFQNLVASIITPKQAIANLKETLANLLVFDEIDDQGNAVDGPLKGLYDSVTSFIKGITGVVSTPKFKQYTKNAGNALGQLVNGIHKLGVVWNKVAGAGFIKSVEKFSVDFTKSLKGFNVTSNVVALTKELQELLNTTGTLAGNFATSSIKATIDLIREFIEVGNELAKGGILEGVQAVIELYKNLLDLANITGLTQAFAKQFKNFYESLNRIVTSPEIKASIVPLVEALDKYLTVLFTSVEKFATKTNFIRTLSEVLTALVNTFTNIIERVDSRIDANTVNKAFSSISNAVTKLLKGLEDVYVEVISSVIQTTGTDTFKRFLDAVVDFVLEVHEAFLELLSVLGGGNVQKGIEKLLSFFTTLIEVATKIVDKLGAWTFSLPLIFSFGNWAISLISTLASVWESLKTLGLVGAGGAGSGLAGILGGIGGKVSTILNTPYTVAWSKALEKGKSVFQSGKGLASGAKNGILSNLVKPFQYNYDEIVKQQLYANKSQMYRGLNGAYDDLIKAMGPNLANNNYAKRLFTQGGASSKYVQNLFKSELATYGDDVAKILAEQSASNYAKVASPLAKMLNGGKAVGLTLGQAGMKGLSSLGKSIPQLTKTISSSMGTLKGTLITTAVNMGVGMLNDHVQNSDASDTAKFWSQLGTSALSIGSWALSGASFGPWGALAGGIIGAGLEAYSLLSGSEDKKKVKEEVVKITEEDKAKALEYVRSLAQHSRELSSEFYSSITKDTSIRSDFNNALGHVMNLSAQSGMSILDTLTSLNVDTGNLAGLRDIDPAKTFVKLGEEVVSLAQLQDETGLSLEELVGTLQYTFGTVGRSTTELTNEAGNSVASINNITEAEKARIKSQLDTLNTKMQQLGVSTPFNNMYEVTNAEKAIDEVMSRKFNSVEEKKKAFAKALANGNAELEKQLLTYDVGILQEMVDRTKLHLSSTSVSTEEHHAKLLEELTNSGKYTKEQLVELERLTVEELEGKVQELKNLNEYLKQKPILEEQFKDAQAYNQLLPVLEGNKKINGKTIEEYLDGSDVRTRKTERLAKELREAGGNTKENRNHVLKHAKSLLDSLKITDKELQDKIVGKLLSSETTLKEAINAVAEEAGGKEEITANLKTTKDNFVKFIIDNVTKGTLKIDEGVKILEQNGINIKDIDTSNIDEKGRETVEAMKERQNEVVKKMEEEKEKSKGWLDKFAQGIAGIFKGIWDTITSVFGSLIEGAKNALFANVPTNHIDNYVKNASTYSVGSGGGAISAGRTSRASFYSTGGFVTNFGNPIYRANGGTTGLSRGTDTIPAMLTEGEYVLRKQAVNSVGLGFLQKLNHEGARALQNLSGRTIITNVYNNNNAKINQNIDNKSQYLNGMFGMDRLMRFV